MRVYSPSPFKVPASPPCRKVRRGQQAYLTKPATKRPTAAEIRDAQNIWEAGVAGVGEGEGAGLDDWEGLAVTVADTGVWEGEGVTDGELVLVKEG